MDHNDFFLEFSYYNLAQMTTMINTPVIIIDMRSFHVACAQDYIAMKQKTECWVCHMGCFYLISLLLCFIFKMDARLQNSTIFKIFSMAWKRWMGLLPLAILYLNQLNCIRFRDSYFLQFRTQKYAQTNFKLSILEYVWKKKS